jgi:outer membrane lipoprotein-sorting protein
MPSRRLINSAGSHRFARGSGRIGVPLALCLLGLAHSASTLSAAAEPLDAILASLAQHAHGQVRFSEDTRSRLLTHEVHSEGVLRFDAPDRLEKQTLAPAPEDLIVEGDVVTIVRGHHRSSIRLSQYPKLSPLLEGLRATLSGNRAALEQRFQVTFAPAASGWELHLAPLGAAGDAGFTRIVLVGHEDALEHVTLEQPNGDRTNINLTPAPPG